MTDSEAWVRFFEAYARMYEGRGGELHGPRLDKAISFADRAFDAYNEHFAKKTP